MEPCIKPGRKGKFFGVNPINPLFWDDKKKRWDHWSSMFRLFQSDEVTCVEDPHASETTGLNRIRPDMVFVTRDLDTGKDYPAPMFLVHQLEVLWKLPDD